MAVEFVGEVYDLHGSLLVGERAIALCGQLGYFVLHGEEVGKELSRSWVGINHYSLALQGNVGMLGGVYGMDDGGVKAVEGLVQGVVDYLRGVVAL